MFYKKIIYILKKKNNFKQAIKNKKQIKIDIGNEKILVI